jgi:pyruvate/2-oxoglutarate dehydrogenase complex dihydrolipoamide acyltransferase (E2) component
VDNLEEQRDMIAEIHIPKLGMTQSDITIVELSKRDGDRVEKDEKALVIETAKVTYEVHSPASGLIFYLKAVKDRVSIGALVGVVCDSREAFESFRRGLPEDEETAWLPDIEDEKEDWGVRLAFEEEAPVGAVLPRRSVTLPAVSLEGRKILRRIPFIGIRRTIAENLVSSLQSGAQLTVFSETDMTDLARFREELVLDYPDTRITFVDMLVKILAFALKAFPILNSTVVRDEIICWDEYHIGVAVALEEGLVVPVVRDADKKSLVAVSREIKRLSKKARQNELDPGAYQGGTFTLSSGGRVETDFMTPIINPPQNAILGIGKIGPRPSVYQGQLAIRTMTYLCLTHDHRVIDGVPASLFLGRMKEIIERRELFSKILK